MFFLGSTHFLLYLSRELADAATHHFCVTWLWICQSELQAYAKFTEDMRILISRSADKLSFKMVCLIPFSLPTDYICKAEVTLLVSCTTYKDNHVDFLLLIYKLNFQYLFTTLLVCFHQHIIWARAIWYCNVIHISDWCAGRYVGSPAEVESIWDASAWSCTSGLLVNCLSFFQ